MKNRYTEEQIIGAIKEDESGVRVDDICLNLGISVDTFCNWCSKYAGLEVNKPKPLKDIESCEQKNLHVPPENNEA